MSRSILVAYATKCGSTRQVAETIAMTLEASGFSVVAEPAAAVPRLGAYDAVVLGTALYMGRPHADARRFLKRHHGALSGLPVAIFAMGPQTTSDADVESSRKQLEQALARVPDVTPISTAVFGGVVNPGKLRFPFNRMEATDARDWGVIEAWANEVGAQLSTELALAV